MNVTSNIPSRWTFSRDLVGDGGIIVFFSSLCAVVSYGLPLLVGGAIGSAWVTFVALFAVGLFSVCTFVLDGRCFLLYWLSLVLLQNAASGFWHAGSSGSVPFAVTESKTVALCLGALLLLPRILAILTRNVRVAVALLVYIAGIAINVTYINSSTLANLRNFLLPVVLIFVAWAISADYGQSARRHFIKIILYVGSFWLFVGTLGELLVGTVAWRSAFSSEALGGLNSLAETTSLFGMTLSRTGGVLFEPVNAGYVAASIITVLILMRLRGEFFPDLGWWLCIAAAAVTLFFAATKNALLMFLVLFGLSLFAVYTRLPIWVGVICAWLGSIAATLGYGVIVKGASYAAGIWSDPIGVSGGESTSIHMAGLVSGIKSLIVTPFGSGVGSGGNFFRLYNPGISREYWLSTGSESAVGTLAYQAGILGLIGFLGLVVCLSCRFGWGGAILLAVWSSAALFAESFFGPIACSIILLVTPFLASVSSRSQRPALMQNALHSSGRV